MVTIVTSNHLVPPIGPFFSLLVKNPELGAQPSVFLAVSEETEGVTGRYFDVMTEKEPASQALDEEVAQRLWEVSSKLVGLDEDGLSRKEKPPGPNQSRVVETHKQNPEAAHVAA